MSQEGHSVSASEAAQKLILYLADELPNLKSISIVAHSFGGIVGREFILLLDKKYILNVVVNLAVPNLGSDLAEYLNYFSNLCKSQISKDLNPERDGYLDKLNDRWRIQFEQSQRERSFDICAAYENIPISGLDGYIPESWHSFGKIIVPKDSAVTFSQSGTYQNVNHFGISKPFNKNDEIYTWILKRLETARCTYSDQANSGRQKRYRRAHDLIGDDKNKILFQRFLGFRQFDSALKIARSLPQATLSNFAAGVVTEFKGDLNSARVSYQKAAVNSEFKALLNDFHPEEPRLEYPAIENR